MRLVNSISAIMLVVVLPGSTLYGQSVREQRLRVKTILGKAEVRSPQTNKWRDLRVGMPVRMGWDVRTFVESSVELSFETGTIIKIGENSVVILDRMQTDDNTGDINTNVRVSTGQVWGNVKKLVGKNSDFEFETPTAVASIRGTRLGVAVDKSGTSVDVFEGAVAVRSRGSRRETLVKTRNRAIVKKGNPAVSVMKFQENKGEGRVPEDPFVAPDSTRAGESDTTVTDSISGIDSTSSVLDSAESDSLAVSDSLASSVDTLVVEEDTRPSGLPLSVSTPAADAVVSSATISVKGKTAPGATVAVRDEQTGADAGGAFSVSVSLDPGPNIIRVEARLGGVSAQSELSVTYRPPLQVSVRGIRDGMLTREPELPIEVQVGDNATYTISIDGAEVGSPVSLTKGINPITITVSDPWGGEKSRTYSVTYTPADELYVDVISPDDGGKVGDPTILVTGRTVAGASVNIDGLAAAVDAMGNFNSRVTLNGVGPDFTILVSAMLDGEEVSEEISVTLEKRMFLSIGTPSSGQDVSETRVHFQGNTVPGATVEINGTPAMVDGGGAFSYDAHMPDEEGEYSFEVVAAFGAEEMTEDILVYYVPPRVPMFLKLSTPKDGADIIATPIRVSGTTVGNARVSVNGRIATVAPSGAFSMDIPISEREIGDYPITVESSDGIEDAVEDLTVVVDIRSPQINRSAPQLQVITLADATRDGTLPIQVTDRTPSDEITLSFEINGSSDDMKLDPNSREYLNLVEGKNRWSVRATDLADNAAPLQTGMTYYLPGPLHIDIIEPASGVLHIDDLPPMPRNAGTLTVDIEVEVDDGIGTVPESILYCRVKGISASGEIVDVQLKNESRYSYTGQIRVGRGRNSFMVLAEDKAGNRVNEPLTIQISD